MTDERHVSRLAALVPELYYDLISRIPAGILLVLAAAPFFASPATLISSIHSLNWPAATILLIILLFVSYSFGLLLTPLGHIPYDLFAPSIWKRVQEENPRLSEYCRQLGLDIPEKGKRREVLRVVLQMGDALRNMDNQAAQVITKMRAEVSLCNNLAAILLLVDLVLFSLAAWHGSLLNQLGALLGVSVATALFVAAGWSVQLQFFRRCASFLRLMKPEEGLKDKIDLGLPV